MSPPRQRFGTFRESGRLSSDQGLVVGIGASAGGLSAFRSFFEAMPADSGITFVVVLHLPAGRKSMLPEILQRWTAMPVCEASDGMVLRPDHVYVPPPHTVTTLVEGRLRVREPVSGATPDYHPIDGFFDSLASELRERAVGIVLSGTGSDGALGLKAVKECGGATIAQGTDGTAPQYDGMPSGAIATGAVDVIAPVQDMPGYLMRLRSASTAEDLSEGEGASPEEIERARLNICEVLRTRVGHDFSGYKDKTFLRRVYRRMQMVDCSTLDQYVTRLEADHNEVVLLFRDLLIRVTSFFRDPEIFDVLEQTVIPRLFEGKHADSTVRVWVPGCATGEEAYSIAILLREHASRMSAAPRVQVFGTDIDEPAIVTARSGRYPPTLLEGLSPERRDRFFVKSDTGYAVGKQIREMCTFSPHSLVRDPPFARMNMVSCRNLLIYMNTAQQASVIPSFHYSLVSGGILLLGSSESTARHEELFEPLDKRFRIFVRREVKSPPLRMPPLKPYPRNGADPLRSGNNGSGGGQGAAADSGNAASGGPRPRDGECDANGKQRSATGKAAQAITAIGRGLARGLARGGTMRAELEHTKEDLRSITEEHATALEELRSSNEELHSVNEELQSTNEELETSKEEIQSVNEELHAVNAQLFAKVEELDRTNSDLRNLFESTEIATVFLDRHLIVRSFTPAVSGIYNLIPSDQGRSLTDIVSQLNYDGLEDDARHVLQTLQPLERRVQRRDGTAFYIMRVLPYRAPDSTVSGTLVTFVDVTSVVQAEQHHRLLVDELNHRVKNMLTVVVSLASQTLRRATSLENFSDIFLGRVHALTASYTLLSNEKWVSVPLRDVILEETRPFTSSDHANIVVDGPDIRLTPTGALAVGMIVHELATNAVKYGALSAANGSVKATWRIEQRGEQETFVFEWKESGGPPVLPPTSRGFGMTLIERGFSHELGGAAALEFEPGGLRAILHAPTAAAVANGNPSPIAPSPPSSGPQS